MVNRISCTTALLLMLPMFIVAQKTNVFQTAMYVENWQKAVNTQEKFVEISPDQWLSLFHLSDAYNAVNRPLDAEKTLKMPLIQTAPEAYKIIAAARIALIHEEQELAAKLFKKAEKAGKKDVVARRTLGESWLYGRSRDLHKAEQLLLNAQKLDARDFLTQMDLGYCYKAMSDGGKALLHFDFAQAIQPQNALPALMSAMVYKSGKVEAKQLEFLDKALTLDPQYIEALRQKGEYFYYKKRDYKAAADIYAQLLALRPKAPIADKMTYVNSLFLTKQYELTIEWVDKIIGEDGSRNYLRRLSGYSYYETGDFEKGKAIMDDYFARVNSDKIIPKDFEYYGKLLQQDNQDSLAAVYYEKAIELDPARWDLYAEIGSIRYKAKDYLGSAEAYEHRLDSLDSRSALDYYQVGLARYMLRDSASYVLAAQYFGKVSEIVPEKTIGWIMMAKSLSKLEPDVETYPEQAGLFGKAKDAFEHFIQLAEQDTTGKHTKDLISAYEYLAYYYILHKDVDNVKRFVAKLQTLDGDSDVVAGMLEWIQSEPADD